jgi:hypothetical protein
MMIMAITQIHIKSLIKMNHQLSDRLVVLEGNDFVVQRSRTTKHW